MKKTKFLLFLFAALLFTFAVPANTMAAGTKTPAGIVAGLTGKSVKDIVNEKLETGKTYGTIAKENGVLKEFKQECLKLKEKNLEKDVKKGYLTQKEADKILDAIKENQAVCDGDGYGRYNGNCGYGYGCGYGKGQGRQGYGKGQGCGYGYCRQQ